MRRTALISPLAAASTARTRRACGAVQPGGATTRPAGLDPPLRDRLCGLIQRLEFYGLGHLQAIVERAGRPAQIWSWTPEPPPRCPRRCRGTPRIRQIACAPVARLAKRATANPASGRLGGRSAHLQSGSTDRGLDARRPAPAGAAAHGLWRRAGGLDTLAAGLARSDHPGNVVNPCVATGLSAAHPPWSGATPRARQHLGWPEAAGWAGAGLGSPPAGLLQACSIRP